jgi:F0F1-type ATP synthase alpha subunit
LMLYRTYKLIEKNTQDQQTSSEASSWLSMQKIGPTGNPWISVSRVGGSAQTKK